MRICRFRRRNGRCPVWDDCWGAGGECKHRTIMADARHDEELLHQNADAFDGEEELPPLYWEGYDRGYDEALEAMAYTRPPRVRPPKKKQKGA